MSSYPRVRRSHVVPAGYLSGFAVDGQLTMYRVGEIEPHTVAVRNAAVRRDFYSRTRPATGERIDDVEWSLGYLESDALPVLRGIRDAWPLDTDGKSRIAALFGYQVIRGPRWMGWHAEFTENWAEEQRDAGDVGDEQIDEIRDQLLSDTPRLTRMLSLGPKVATVLGSMHWSLIEFGHPRLATSDHPVVVWPAAERSRIPQPSPLNRGLLYTLEVAVPLFPDVALLMTWLDRRDDAAPVRGTHDHAATLNAFVVAQAEQQWFHAPGPRPRLAAGMLVPLSAQLYYGYDAEYVSASRRRDQTDRNLQARLGSDDLDQTIELVTVA